MKARVFDTYDAFLADGKPGAVWVQPGKALWLVCPGCGQRSRLALAPHGSPQWNYAPGPNGPGLWPSIHHDEPPLCNWHGWLEDGVFKHV